MWGGGVNLVSSTPSGAESKEVVSADYVLAKAGGLPVGSIVAMPFGVDESENKFRYLNGQTIVQSQFAAFTAKVKFWQTTRTNLFTTETNWQAEKTASVLGQCGKFVIDDDAGTIRLPCVVNINGLTDLANCGVVKSESLPNIGGSLLLSSTVGFRDDVNTGPFSIDKTQEVGNIAQANSNYKGYRLNFNLAAANNIYKDNGHVQQEAVQYPYIICVNSGVEEANRPINNYQVNNVYSYGMSQYYKGTMNNNSWLKSAGQWNSGTVYTGVYNWALEQMNAGIDGFKGTIGYAWKMQDADIRWWTTNRNPSVGDAVYGDVGIIFVGNITVVNSDGSIDFESDFYGKEIQNLVYTETENINSDGTGWGNLKFINDYDWCINTEEQTFRLPLLNGEESIPDWDNHDTLTVSESGQTYIATTNGCYQFSVGLADSTYFAIFHGNTGNVANLLTNETAAIAQNYVAKTTVKRGDTIRIQYNGTPTIKSARFYHAVCESGSLYFYVGDTLQNASLIDIAKLGEAVATKTNKVQAAAASMPSTKYVNPTFGASGTEYIAPANGWFYCITQGNASYLYIINQTLADAGAEHGECVNLAGGYYRVTLPARKGDRIKIHYDGTPTFSSISFHYAEGDV